MKMQDYKVCVCGELISNRTGIWRRVGREGFIPCCRVSGGEHKPKPEEKQGALIADIRNGVRYYPDGREVCQASAEGRREYSRRGMVAWDKQQSRCALCDTYLSLEATTVDHIKPRGMGGARRDDRQENIQAVHALCNSAKGSKRV